MNVTVFGGSAPQPGEEAYVEAQELGRRLAKAGHAVLTGGYMGTMEAVSRGAAEAGGQVIGVTCEQIKAWRQAKANPWVGEERRFPTLRERMYHLIEACDAALALPGGVGTLAEVAVMWSQMQTVSMPARPLILIGAGWQRTFEQLFAVQDAYIPAGHRALLGFAPDAESALDTLQKALK